MIFDLVIWRAGVSAGSYIGHVRSSSSLKVVGQIASSHEEGKVPLSAESKGCTREPVPSTWKKPDMK